MVTNEQVTLYFKEIKQEKFVQKLVGKFATKNPRSTLLEKVQTKHHAK